MKYIKVKNFDKYQHYKERHITSWIKLYYSVLDDYVVSGLLDNERWVWISLLLMAGKTENQIPLDVTFLQNRMCHKNTNIVDLQAIIDKFISIDLIYTVSITNRREKRREEKKREEPPSPAKRPTLLESKNPNHRLLGFWCKLYQEQEGLVYNVNFSKEGKLIKTLYEQYEKVYPDRGEKYIQTVMAKYLETARKDAWLKDKISVGMFSSRFNETAQKVVQR